MSGEKENRQRNGGLLPLFVVGGREINLERIRTDELSGINSRDLNRMHVSSSDLKLYDWIERTRTFLGSNKTEMTLGSGRSLWIPQAVYAGKDSVIALRLNDFELFRKHYEATLRNKEISIEEGFIRPTYALASLFKEYRTKLESGEIKLPEFINLGELSFNAGIYSNIDRKLVEHLGNSEISDEEKRRAFYGMLKESSAEVAFEGERK